MKKYDHIILGTGQATGTLLGRLIHTGASIAVIEGGKVGGSCVNYGCTPTKALVASAKAFYNAGRGAEFGFTASEVKLDFPRVKERMDEIRNGSSNGLTNWMESTENVDLFNDWGTFEDDHTLKVGEELLTAENIYINTGTRPVAPPIEGLVDVPWLDSARLLDLEKLPDHLIIIGGGYIGIEFSQVYRRFGSKVTVIQRSRQIMPREDEDVSGSVKEFLEEEGVEIICNATSQSVSKEGNIIKLKIFVDGKEQIITGSHLLIAAGRKPNSDKLNLDATGIKTNSRGYIAVDDFCQTSVAGVFAVGDVNGHGGFTHTAVNDAEIVLDHLFGGKRKISDRIPVYGLFTDPPLGRVGMSEKEAIEKGINVMKATRKMATISRAKEMSETTGFAKLLVEKETDLVIGASILGVGGDEIINMFATIMHSKIPCRHYREVVLVHPTVSELMPWVLDTLAGIIPEETRAQYAK
ncbi:MAG: mercuric reductase [Bacteroidota bacterium]